VIKMKSGKNRTPPAAGKPENRRDAAPSSVKHHCQAVPQRELVRKSCSFITFYFYVLSLEYPQALSSSI